MASHYSASNILRSATLESWFGTARPLSTSADYGATAAAFPVSQVANLRAGSVARFRELRACQLSASFPTPRTVSFVALVNHNLDDAATVNLMGADSELGPWDTVAISMRQGSVFHTFASTARKFWRLEFPGTPNTTDGQPVQIGEWWMGTRAELPPFVWGLEDGYDVIESFNESEYGVPHTHFLAQRRVMNGAFIPALSVSAAEVLEQFKRAVRGRVTPFLFMPDDAHTEQVHMGRFATNSWRKSTVPIASTTTARTAYAGVDFQFTEDPFGNTGA